MDFLVPSQVIGSKRQPQCYKSHQQNDTTQARISHPTVLNSLNETSRIQTARQYPTGRHYPDGRQCPAGRQYPTGRINHHLRQERGLSHGLRKLQDYHDEQYREEVYREEDQSPESYFRQDLRRSPENYKLQQPGGWVGISAQTQTRNLNHNLAGQQDTQESFYWITEERDHYDSDQGIQPREFEEHNKQDNQLSESEESENDGLQEHLDFVSNLVRDNPEMEEHYERESSQDQEYEQEDDYEREPDYYEEDYEPEYESYDEPEQHWED